MIKLAMMSFYCLHNKTLSQPCGMVIICLEEKPMGKPCGFEGLEECALVSLGQLVNLECHGRSRKWVNGFPYFFKSSFKNNYKPLKHLIEKTAMLGGKCWPQTLQLEMYLLEFGFSI